MLRLRHLLEYAVLRTALLFMDRLSLPAAERQVRRLSDCAYAVLRGRRRIAQENLLRSGIARDAGEADRIARESFRHLGTLVLESLRSKEVFNESNWRDKVELDIPDAVEKILSEPGQGVILVSAHIGNWEIAAQLLSYIKPVVGITSNMNNPYTDRIMKKRKPRNRFRLTPKRDLDAGRFLRILKGGEILALLGDQHARKGGMMIDFFGTAASTHTSSALLHLITKAPLVFGTCIRTGPMRYRLKAVGPIEQAPTGNRKKDIQSILERITRETEDVIKEFPDQYLWAHRRWRIKA